MRKYLLSSFMLACVPFLSLSQQKCAHLQIETTNKIIVSTYSSITKTSFPIIEVFKLKQDQNDLNYYYLNKRLYSERKLIDLLKKIKIDFPDQHFRILYDPNESREKLDIIKSFMKDLNFRNVKYYSVLNLAIEFEEGRKVVAPIAKSICHQKQMTRFNALVSDYISLSKRTANLDLSDPATSRHLISSYESFFIVYEKYKNSPIYKAAMDRFKRVVQKLKIAVDRQNGVGEQRVPVDDKN